ncbi:integrase arm-type DNA-binding domain-containing protein [Oxalobacter aliiformigenes]|uniref:tyrosine-type recombinase/integrase n=1 Tax=Oxalobacter aliiformigenes TaxID=2946593 RepID=UPI0022AED908|nr:integrase arm-type DNA-binding domain-containing protein [Oxalobacter aliiformigenes]MCZ4063905.1 integrase arm-type DNA-binding domain-containing protein [Oxalobacter aliiformigenes]WAV98527.1 integrase arm-type DNA-binding domain-containing protein [Oxalobacter aliiformigenes]
MAKLITPLVPKQIDNAKPKEKPYALFDGGGLYIEVMPTGSKLWRMKATLNGKAMRLSFGKYPDISLAQARKKRDEARKLIAEGIDPREEKKAHIEAVKAAQAAKAADEENTFRKIALRLYASKAGRTTDYYRNKMIRQLELHLFPFVGDKNIRDIEGRELADIFKGVAEKKNKEGKPMTYMAKRLCQWTAEVYDLANVENSSFNLNNPCRSIVKFLPKHKTEHAEIIPFEQLPDFIRALQTYGGHILTKAAIWMLLYTGMRQASVRRAQWSDFDMEAAIWNRKEEKSREQHVLPLPRQAIALLDKIRPLTGGRPEDLVFPSIYQNKLQMGETAVGTAIKNMGFDADGHGMRGTVITGLNELGYDFRKIEKQVDHALKNSTEAAYNHARLFDARREMMQEWADYLDSLKTGKVIPLKRA